MARRLLRCLLLACIVITETGLSEAASRGEPRSHAPVCNRRGIFAEQALAAAYVSIRPHALLRVVAPLGRLFSKEFRTSNDTVLTDLSESGLLDYLGTQHIVGRAPFSAPELRALYETAEAEYKSRGSKLSPRGLWQAEFDDILDRQTQAADAVLRQLPSFDPYYRSLRRFLVNRTRVVRNENGESVRLRLIYLPGQEPFTARVRGQDVEARAFGIKQLQAGESILEITIYFRDLPGLIHEWFEHVENLGHTKAFFAEAAAGGEVFLIKIGNETIPVAVPRRAIREIETMSQRGRNKLVANTSNVASSRVDKFPTNQGGFKLYDQAMIIAIYLLAGGTRGERFLLGGSPPALRPGNRPGARRFRAGRPGFGPVLRAIRTAA